MPGLLLRSLALSQYISQRFSPGMVIVVQCTIYLKISLNLVSLKPDSAYQHLWHRS